MRIIYGSKKVEKWCTDIKSAKKLFGGQDIMVRSLFSRINALQEANVIKDIILTRPFHFHKLAGTFEGYYSIDVKSRKDPWRIIIQLLDENENPYIPNDIDKIALLVKVVRVEEVSKHYE